MLYIFAKYSWEKRYLSKFIIRMVGICVTFSNNRLIKEIYISAENLHNKKETPIGVYDI